MGWYEVVDASGSVLKTIFVSNLEDLQANTPTDCTVRPCDPPSTTD